MSTDKIVIALATLFFVTLFLRRLVADKSTIVYTKNGAVYLGFLGVGVITVMDVLTSIFYAPAESFRFVGYDTLLFMPLTALIIAGFAFSMTEIARIMEKFGYRGGGVYSFSYMVFGRNVSLVAAASILVDYVNTAAISSISAVENLQSFVALPEGIKLVFELLIVWGIALLNIAGIKENSKITFYLFAFICYVLGITIALGFYNLEPQSAELIKSSLEVTSTKLADGGLVGFIHISIVGIGSTILAYSGIESVLQTGKLTENWKTIKKAYIFLVIFIGIITPTISLLALVSIDNPAAHDANLIPTFADMIGGPILSILIVIVAFAALVFAVNTATIAGTELIAMMCERFGLKKPLKTNKHGAKHYLILFLAFFFSAVILMTGGSQATVADMYAIGIVATFAINLAALLTFRFTQGFSHIKEYKSSFIKNLLLFGIFIAVLLYLGHHKQTGFLFWALTSIFMLALGLALKGFEKGIDGTECFNSKFDVVSCIEKMDSNEINIVFLRAYEISAHRCNTVYITFALGRLPAPDRMSEKHFLLPINSSLQIGTSIKELLTSLQKWHSDREFTVYFNWPVSSWRKRLFLAIMINRILKLPLQLPHIRFRIEYAPHSYRID